MTTTYNWFDAVGIERRLWEAVIAGDEVVAQSGEVVPAGLIRQLAAGGGLPKKPHRLRLTGAEIIGKIDFEASTLLATLELTDCDFEEINLEQAHAPAIYLRKCRFNQLNASQFCTNHDLSLADSQISGRVYLIGARIGGVLKMDGTRIINPGGDAFVADGLRVDDSVRCNAPFQAEGNSQMVGAEILGQFSSVGGKFINPSGNALRAVGLTVKERIIWRDGFIADGDLSLAGATVEGNFDLRRSELNGSLDLTGSQVDGSFDCTGGHFTNSGKIALDLARAEIRQHVIFRNGFVSDGQVLLTGASIGGSLWCEGGQIRHATDTALLADGVKVGGDVVLGTRFFDDRNVAEQFSAEGEVTFANASIKGSFNCKGGRFSNSGRISLNARGLHVKRSLKFNEATVVEGSIDLRRARVGELVDEQFNWPTNVNMLFFIYDTLRQPVNPSKEDVDSRISWLERNGRYAPQIYNQLACVYRSEGRDEHTERVLIAKEKARRNRWWEKLKGFFFRITVGYGFSPLRILIWLATLEVIGGILFSILRDDIKPVPSKGGDEVSFQPWLYTLDLLLPVVDLRQRDLVIPHSAALWLSTGFTISGWILGTVLAIGIVNMVKRPV